MEDQLKISFYQIGIEVDFENIFSFCKFTETAMEQEKTRFEELYTAKLSKLNDEETKADFQRFMEVHWKLHDVFPALQWNSIFNTAYTMFENHMNQLCKILTSKTCSKISLKDINGKGIERAKVFISKVIGINDVFDSPEWNEIKRYSELRNVLVHASGTLDLSQSHHKKVLDYAKKHSKLVLDSEDPDSGLAQILVLPTFIYDALLCYRVFLARICSCQLEISNG